MQNKFLAAIVFAFVFFPALSRADVTGLPRLETSVAGSYPEVISSKTHTIGLEVSITYGPLGWKEEKFFGSVSGDRKLSVPDLSKLTVDAQKDLLPINVQFSVPSPDILSADYGVSYLRSLVFLNVEEYQSFFSSPLVVSFLYSSPPYRDPVTYKLTTKDGSSFSDWYSANVVTSEKANCLFATIKFLTPQATRGYSSVDHGGRIGPSGTTTGRATFLVFRSDQPLNYELTVFTSTNPYVCNTGSSPSPTESMSKILMTEIRSANVTNFPNQISVVVP